MDVKVEKDKNDILKMKDNDSKSKDDENGRTTGDAEKKKEKKPMVGYLEMYRFADGLDKFFLFLGFLCAAFNGAALTLISPINGDTVENFVTSGRLDLFLDRIPDYLKIVNLTRLGIIKDPSKLEPECAEIDFYYNTSGSCRDLDFEDSLSEKSKESTIIYCIFGGLVIFTALGQIAFFQITSEKQANRIRRIYLANILRQDIGWFDTHDAAELNTRLSGDIIKIQSGMGEGMAMTIQYLTRFVVGYGVGFAYGWELSLVLVSLSPLLISAAAMLSYAYVFMAAKDQKAYAKAGAIAEEVLSSIRTVVAFAGEQKESDRYSKHLSDVQKSGNKKGLITGITVGFLAFVSFCTYALGLWYGGRLVRHDKYEVSDVIAVFFSIALGTFALGTSVTGIQSLTEGRGAAYAVFQLIDMKSAIDSSSTEGEKLKNVEGNITFKNVHFSYPSRPDVKVLCGVSVDAQSGQTIAIVGSSGCGKSTLVQLLLRFYDPQKGKILFDGHDLRDINIKCLRQSIGLVSQEPVLFDTTIAGNIKYGRDGVTDPEIVQAAKDANAYKFITQFPQGFETVVGERGTQLSGGQKQRIAIARALVRNPKILLLDEATSALDTESESLVQDALDKARQGRTTLVIAHRLSTIRSADFIIGLDNGKVQEVGTHEQLIEKRGIYYSLVMNQTQSVDNEGEVNNELSREDVGQVLQVVEDKRFRRKSSLYDPLDPERQLGEDMPDVSSMELLRLNSPEWLFIALGFLGAVFYGGAQPAFSFFFSEILSIFSEDDEKQKRELRKQSLYLILVGLVSFVGAILQSWMLSISGGALTRRLREGSFRAMLKQEMAWFDRPCNSTGALTNRLAQDASLVQEAGGIRLGVLLQCIVGVIAALAVSFYYSWQLTLVSLAFFPLIMLTGVMQMRVFKGNAASTKESLEGASMIAVDAIENMRTVSSLTIENIFYESYRQKISVLLDSLYKHSIITGLLFAVSQAVIYFSLAVIFSLGAYLIEEGDLDANDVFKVIINLIFSALFLGQAASFGPDLNRAQAATKRIFYMLRRETKIDADSPDGVKLDEILQPVLNANNTHECQSKHQANSMSGVRECQHWRVLQEINHKWGLSTRSIKVQNASFCYPVRPNVQVLAKLNFTVKPGQTVALVGSSGCGKSTVISLLERFYNLKEGTLSINNYDIKDLNIRWLRAQIGLVSQEPVLFDCSITDNIAYGDNSRMVPMDEIVTAARQANIHNFIQGLPNGYETNVGERGTQLSGGQKQRIAIARALVRKPKILLLDEATSALDTENEKIVQDALDRAREGRTCIVIAHRLSSIQDADNIIVIDSGRVVEQGTHEQLLALRGFYSKLQKNKN